ncbi:MAG TPA: SH3 domain-containing protein [Chloroflexota bacterium]
MILATLWCAGCGVLPGTSSAPPPTPTSGGAAAPAVSPGASPSASGSPAAAASPSPAATTAAAGGATSVAKPTAPPNTVYVGNTDGEGVFIRKTPAMDDKVRAYSDGTPLTLIGEDVDGDGQHWKHVRTPDGLEGYVPSQYTTTTPS